MFESWSRSWTFAKESYGILWRCKRLLIFPILSAVAAILVIASFVIPLWQSGTIQAWAEAEEGQSRTSMYVTMFLFYFCNYFVIVFFNAALIASALKYLEDGTASVGYGLGIAMKRLPQVLGWALVSAVVGTLLRVIEGSNKRAGQFIAAILGMAWTAMTYCVVPVIVVDGAGPVKAFKESLRTLKSQWGTALVGNFSLGLLGFLLVVPIAVVMVLLFLAVPAGAVGLKVAVACFGVILVLLAVAASSAADVIFQGLLFSYATGQTLPEEVNAYEFNVAFVAKDEKSS